MYIETSTEPLPEKLVSAFFNVFVEKKDRKDSTKEVWKLKDGSTLILKNAFGQGVYLELRYVFSDNFHLLNHFFTFCQEQGSSIKSKNHGATLTSLGALFSDYKNSKAFREYLHAKTHPKDIDKAL